MKNSISKNNVKPTKSEILKYKNFRITKSTNGKYTEMVTITRCVSGLKSFLGKRFINLQKVKEIIDYQMSLILIEQRSKNVKSQLSFVVVGNTNW